MSFLAAIPFTLMADASAASNIVRSYVTPTVATLCGLASVACAAFLVYAGIQYMTSSGNPEKLEHAKKVLKNAMIGLVLVIAAATLTAILSHAYSSHAGVPTEKFPSLQPIEPANTGIGIVDALISGVAGLLRNMIESVAEPFIKALDFFLQSTPLMGDNASVFNMWLTSVAIADVLFVLVVALLGFHVMSAATLGLDEIEFKHLLPRFVLAFIAINTSIFLIDMVIELSNVLVTAVTNGFPSKSIWDGLILVTKMSSGMSVAGLLVMVAFLILAVMLLIYYVMRLITLYLGAILSPLVLLLWLIPTFKDFAYTALKTYLTNIFVLFVHVVILLLANSIFVGLLVGNTNGQPNALMSLIVGLATVVTLLKTQGFMQNLSYAASAPKAARQLSRTFVRSVQNTYKGAKHVKKGAQKAGKYVRKGVNKLTHSNSNSKGVTKKDSQLKNRSNTKVGGSNYRTTASSPRSKKASVQPMQTGETQRAAKPKTDNRTVTRRKEEEKS